MDNYQILVSESSEQTRAEFYKKTYSHVALALLAFLLVETILLKVVPASMIEAMFGGRMLWLMIIGLFWLGSFMADKFAFSPSRSQQYFGLGLYVLIEAIIFLPMIYIAMNIAGTEILMQAGLITLFMFSGLTALVFMTNYDFSFLRTGIILAGFISLGLIVVGAIFGFNLGLWFSVGMVVLASASILYQTNQLKHNYSPEQYVGAALQVFASIMLLFWYILRILMSRRN